VSGLYYRAKNIIWRSPDCSKLLNLEHKREIIPSKDALQKYLM